MKKSLMIFKIVTKIWKVQIKKLLNTRSKLIMAELVVLSIILLSGICGYLLSGKILSLFLKGDLRIMYMLLITESITISVVAFALFILFKGITPEQNVIIKLLSWFPIKNRDKKLGYYMPQILSIVLCALTYAFILYLPAMFVYRIKLYIIFAFVVCLCSQAIFITLLSFSMYNLLYFIFKKIKVPYHKNITLLSLTIIYIIYVSKYVANLNTILTNYKSFDYSVLIISIPLYLIMLNISNLVSVKYIFIVLAMLSNIIVFALLLNLGDVVEKKRSSKLFRIIKFPRNKLGTLIVKEIKVQIRNEEIIMFYFFLIILAALLRLKLNINISNVYVIIFISNFCAVSAMNSFGAEESIIPLYKNISINYFEYTISKLLGSFILSLFMYILLTVILFSFKVKVGYYCIGIINVFIGVTLLYLLGVIVPINNKRPYIQGIVMFFLILIMMPTIYIMNKLSNLPILIIMILIFLIQIITITLIFHISKKRWFLDLE